ncbi:MAG: hypothetical protein S4CHLAM2_07750 [Chlamydiales bacterium]|nr:hypothetical protein [Chlamydiales bacterium]
MKKAILSILFLGLACAAVAREFDQTENELINKVKWCQLEGLKLYESVTDQENTPHESKMYMDTAMKFFQLERDYASDLRWHRFMQAFLEAMDDEDEYDCWDDNDEMRAIKLKTLMKKLAA